MNDLSNLRCWLSAIALVFSLRPAPALDFTPQETWRGMEGVRIPVVLFSDPTGRIRYQPPGKWKFNGSGPSFALYPSETHGAFMKFFVLGHAPGLPKVGDYSSADLGKWAQNYIATDAKDVKVLAENPSPFMLSGRPSREFLFDYKSAGQHFQTSVAVLDWNEREYMAVVITALEPEFKAVHDAGTSSLFSWNLRPTGSNTPTPAAPAPGPTPIKAVDR